MKACLPSLLLYIAALAAAISGHLSEDLALDHGLLLYPRQSSAAEIQFFSGALGGATAAPVTPSGDAEQPFEVGGDKFTDFATAAGRACDNQHNTCADLSNNKTGDFSVGQCDEQSTQCKAAISTATQTSFSTATLFSSTGDFDIFCDP